MICPIQSAGAYANPQDENPVDCAHEKCAWWDEKQTKCAVAVLAAGVDLISGVLMDDIRGALNAIAQSR